MVKQVGQQNKSVPPVFKETRLRLFLARTGLRSLLRRAGYLYRRLFPEPGSNKPSIFQSLNYKIALGIDYLTFWLRYNRIFSKGRELADPNKKLMILSFTNFLTQVKSEAFLAKALQLRGFTPVIVTNSSVKSVLKYYRIFGFDQFIFFDNYLKSEISSQAIAEAEAFFARSLTVQDVKNYTFRGTRLGAHMLRMITRTTYKGSIDLSDFETRRSLKSFLLQGMHNVEQAEILLEQVRPEVIFTHHPLSLGEGDIYEVGLQRGINTIYWDGAQKDDYWLFKRYTKDANDKQLFSLSDETWDLARRMVWDEQKEATLSREIEGRYQVGSGLDGRRLQEGKRLKTKTEVQQQLSLDSTKKTAVIFSHIVWDTSFLYGVDLFSTYEEWLVETTRAACKNPAVNWVIKLHPANLKKLKGNDVEGEASEVVAIRNAIGSLPDHVKFLDSDTDVNTFSLFAITDYCLTVRGTIGIEMPCYGIPVFTAGTGRYSGRGFTIDSTSAEDYLGKLNHIQDYPRLHAQQIMLAKIHAYWLFCKRPVRFDIAHKVLRKNLVKNVNHPLVTNYVFHISSLNSIISNPDLSSFCRWVIDGKQFDYLQDVSHVLERSG